MKESNLNTRVLLTCFTLTILTGAALAAETDPIRDAYEALPRQAKPFYYQQSEKLTKPVPKRLVELDQLTIGCFAPSTIMAMSANDTNLGGQCCGVLRDIQAYEVQLKALHRFIDKHGGIDLIPRDPYDVSVTDAQRLIELDRSIVLTAAQQQTYDQAVKKSHHGGPCCCKCWKWYTMSGLGKKLIAGHGWTSAQLAELWDTSSSCGHAHDTNMHQHYNVSNDESDKHGHGR